MSLIPWFKITNANTGAFVGASSGFDRTWAWCEEVEKMGRHVAPVEFDDSTIAEVRAAKHFAEVGVTPKHRANFPSTTRIVMEG